MRSLYTAIIHLRNPIEPNVQNTLEPLLNVIRGVDAVSVEPEESLVTLDYDGDQTGLAEIVRAIEDSGSAVSGVAQRRVTLRLAG